MPSETDARIVAKTLKSLQDLTYHLSDCNGNMDWCDLTNAEIVEYKAIIGSDNKDLVHNPDHIWEVTYDQVAECRTRSTSLPGDDLEPRHYLLEMCIGASNVRIVGCLDSPEAWIEHRENETWEPLTDITPQERRAVQWLTDYVEQW